MPPADALAHMAQMVDAIYELVAINRLALLALILMVGTTIWFAVIASTFARESRDLAERQVERSRELAAMQAERTRERSEMILDRLEQLSAEISTLRARLGDDAPVPAPASTPANPDPGVKP